MSDPALIGGVVADPALDGTVYGGQGPAGPSPTINGKTGQTITLTAGDVGAYTKAEVDQAITAAVSAQFGADFLLWFAALPTALPSLPGQPWNNGGTFAVS